MSEVGIGHNQSDMTETAQSTAGDLSVWMMDNPVIQTEDQARAAKVLIDRGVLCVKDLEDERMGQTRPLNEQVEQINNHYRAPRNLIKGVIDELKWRFDSFLLREEEKRYAAAAKAERLAQEAEGEARAAEIEEREAIDEANAGTLGLDIAAVTAKADDTFEASKKAWHKAAIAERETKVRIGGGFGRTRSLGDKNTPVVADPIEAIKDIGLTNVTILDAIVRASRAFKTVFGRWPKGITIKTERKS